MKLYKISLVGMIPWPGQEKIEINSESLFDLEGIEIITPDGDNKTKIYMKNGRVLTANVSFKACLEIIEK